MSTKMVEIAQIADSFGLDRNNLRKRLKDEGFILLKQRVKARRGQFCLHVTAKDAKTIVARLKQEGYQQN